MLVGGAAGGYAFWDYSTAPVVGAVSDGASGLLRTATPKLEIAAENTARLKVDRLLIDGADRTNAAVVTPNGIVIDPGKLQDGDHEVVLATSADGLFGSPTTETWSFTVDTTPPELTVVEAPKKWLTSAELSGTGEPGSKLDITWPSGSEQLVVPDDGKWKLAPAVEDGITEFALAATDVVGNTTVGSTSIKIDRTPPELSPPAFGKWTKDRSPELLIGSKDRTKVRYKVVLNGEQYKPKTRKQGVAIKANNLNEGLQWLTVTATDGAGNKSKLKHTFGVDSTEKLAGQLTLTMGARGADIQSLTRRLRVEGFFKGKPQKRYTGRVRNAVKAWQKAKGLPVDGITRPALILATEGKIVIDKNRFLLTAYRDGKVVAKYPVAVGQPAYPSPTGTYVVTEKLKDPTWIPPNSPWAKGLEPIPPGSGNPLGTRWIGTSAPASASTARQMTGRSGPPHRTGASGCTSRTSRSCSRSSTSACRSSSSSGVDGAVVEAADPIEARRDEAGWTVDDPSDDGRVNR